MVTVSIMLPFAVLVVAFEVVRILYYIEGHDLCAVQPDRAAAATRMNRRIVMIT